MKSAARAIHDAYALFVTKDSNALEMPYADLRSIASDTTKLSFVEFEQKITADGKQSARLGAKTDKAILEACEAAYIISYVENLNPVAKALAMYVHAPLGFLKEDDHYTLLGYVWAHCATPQGVDKGKAEDFAMGRGGSQRFGYYRHALAELAACHTTLEQYKQIQLTGRLHRPATAEKLISNTKAFEKKSEAVYDALDRVDRFVLVGLSNLIKGKDG